MRFFASVLAGSGSGSGSGSGLGCRSGFASVLVSSALKFSTGISRNFWPTHTHVRFASSRMGGAGERTVGVEIEAKFTFTKEVEERIAKDPNVVLVNRKRFTDVYYDCRDKQYPLTTRDIWLRQRSDKWEIKIPVLFYREGITTFDGKTSISPAQETNASSYVELHEPDEIYQFLKQRHLIGEKHDLSRCQLEEALKQNDMTSCATLTTYRTTYKHDDVTIDLDLTEPLQYRVGELEVITKGDSEQARKEALEKISAVARHHNLDIQKGMRGKVLEYLWCYSRDHYEQLRRCGLLASKDISES